MFALPLYEYQCRKCHSLMERIQKFSDPPLTTCPHCGGELEQLISAPAVQFKGSGWYVTDYAKGSSKDSGKSGNGSASPSSSEGKSIDSKGSDDAQSKPSSGEKASSTSDQPAGKK
ncbi:MAG: FmdB family zinc ribbon protein [Candidatus Korobacteraceae bacterium]